MVVNGDMKGHLSLPLMHIRVTKLLLMISNNTVLLMLRHIQPLCNTPHILTNLSFSVDGYTDSDTSIIVDGVNITTSMGYYPFGFHNTTTYDMDTQEWLQIGNAKGQDNEHFYSNLDSVYGLKEDRIIYFDGRIEDRRGSDLHAKIDDFKVSIFDLKTYSWEYASMTGDIPTGYFPSKTLLPDNDTILFYGESTTPVNGAPENNCYILNIRSWIGSRCISKSSDTVYSPRNGHSAVLVGHHLFILFGSNSYNTLDKDLIILDVSNKDDIVRVSSYAYKDGPISKHRLQTVI